jgi:hypothetical protein
MEKQPNVIVSSGGVKCDNKSCDYIDKTATVERYSEYLNKPCPKCGENLLTEEDYNLAQQLNALATFMNSLTQEQIDELNRAQGVELDPKLKNKKVSVTFNAHKSISIDKIEPID